MSFMTQLSRPWRLLLISLLSVAGLLLVLLVLISLLLSTNSGSRWVLAVASEQVNKLPGARLEFASSEGALVRGLELTSVVTEFGGTTVSADELELVWNPFTLLSGHLLISQIRTLGLTITVPPADSAPEVAKPVASSLIEFSPLPFGLEISELILASSRIHIADQSIDIDRFSLAASLVETEVQLDNMHLAAFAAAVEGDIRVQLRDFLPLAGNLRWTYSEALSAQVDSLSGELSVTGDLLELNLTHRLLQPFVVQSTGSYQTGLGSESAPGNPIDFVHTAENLVLPLANPADINLQALSLQTTGDINRLLINLSTTIEAENIPQTKVTADAVYSGTELVLDTYEFVTETGALRGSAQVDWSQWLVAQIDYRLVDSDPLSYLASALPLVLKDLDSAGSVRLEVPDSGLQAELTIQHFTAQLSDYPVSGQGAVSYSDNTIDVTQMELNTAENQISLSGVYGDTLNLRWDINAPRLEQILIDARGSVIASGLLQGTLVDPIIDADARINGLEYGSFSVADISLTIASDSGSYDGDLLLQNGQFASATATQQLQELSIDFAGAPDNHQVVTSIKSDYANIDLVLAGGVDDLENPQWQGSLTRANIDSVVGQWLSVRPTTLSIAADIITLSEHCWSQQGAQLCLQLNSELADKLTANARLRDYPLSVVNQPEDTAAQPLITLPGFQYLPSDILVQGVAVADVALTLPYGGDMDLAFRLQTQGSSVTIKGIEVAGVDEAIDDASVEAETEDLLETNIGWELVDLQGKLQAGAWEFTGQLDLEGASDEPANLGLEGNVNLVLGISEGQDLNGNMLADFGSLSWLQALVPALSATTGQLDASLGIAGSIQAPEVTGSLNLQRAGTTIDALGITLTGLNATVSSTDSALIGLNASARSGEGEFTLNARLTDPFSIGRELTAELAGSNFQLADIPDLKLAISPDISFQIDADAIRFDGEVVVPLMNLELSELPPSAVDISRDVIILSYPEDNPELARSIAAEQASLFSIPIIGEVDLSLGEDVSFIGFGMDARLGGSLNIRQQANGSNLTYGELSVLSGGYELYGQRLTLERGKILFLGAYDNPAVDIRATRRTEDVPGLAEDITAGVIMNGTIKKLSSQLFSTPVLPENDILAIIVTGKPLSAASGQQDSNAILGSVARLGLDKGQGFTNQIRDGLGLDTLEVTNTRDINNSALTVGKYLTPQIFVRYGIGLFDNQSTVAVDYSVTNNIKLQAESGEYQSVDITYTIER